MIGRLLERTEALMEQHSDFKRTLDSLDTTLESFGKTITKLESALDHITRTLPSQEKLIERIGSLELQIGSWTVARKYAVHGAVVIALLALTWGTVGGTLLRQAIGLP